MLTFYLVVSINGLTFSLIAILVGFLNFINNNTQTITPAIEVLIVLILVIIIINEHQSIRKIVMGEHFFLVSFQYNSHFEHRCNSQVLQKK